ncbi:MAG: PIN domain-containing protein [Oscillospiraceae bacterium]|nr:PIN domain-containing protein [Oscillospiraceae bacterium]
MRVFLIDFENVHSEGMTGVDHLSELDEVVIFYSNNADSISFDILHKLMFCKSKLSYYKIKRGGKNALDFQLSCYLGYRIRKDPDAEFYIISKDSGYDFIMDFWDCGYINTEPVIRRFNNIKTLLQWVDSQKKQKERAINSLDALIKNSEVPETESEFIPKEEEEPLNFTPSPEEAETAASLMSDAKNSHGLYINMVKRFGQKKGREIYGYFKSEYQSMLRSKKEEEKNQI